MRKQGGQPTHGMWDSPTYKSWAMMKQRCMNPNYNIYERYGARGISVCEEWMTFEGFLKDMGMRPENTSLDRIDVNGNYEPSNCRWATTEEQMNNTRRNRCFMVGGENLNITQLSKKYGIYRKTLDRRLRIGWDINRALTEPIHKGASA